MNAEQMTTLNEAMASVQAGRSHDPFAVLGRHDEDGCVVVRAFMPSAETVELDSIGPMERIEGSDLFECRLDAAQAQQLPQHYCLNWIEKSVDADTAAPARHCVVSPYSFAPTLPDDDLYYFGQGQHYHAYRILGAHRMQIDGYDGVRFAVWAPAVERVSVVGDFNGWHGLRHQMRSRGGSGVWEIFIPGLQAGDLYKFAIASRNGPEVLKADPYARQMTLRPDTACQVVSEEQFGWQDQDWLQRRAEWDWQHQPMSVYELHPGSWKRHADNSFFSYRDLADHVVPYLVEMGYTHVELLPIMEHPLDESWGYQVSGYFAPSARYGDPEGFRYLVDLCHRHNIGVILDWVPGHFPRDEFALARFTGEALYEHADPRRGEHRDWGTLIFDYGRNEVRNFLLANAVYWFEEFHIDGLRVDAVASMLYLDYSRDDGDWLPNEFGGRENLDAISFLKLMNEVVLKHFPGGLTIAEESTAWPNVSRPTWMDGLGFSMKWNMGWMNDTLSYFEEDPVNRSYHHNKLTFSQLYAYSENFVLPFSHDEVVHMKRSLLDKMPGDLWQKFANLRLLLSWQMTHPGKKLLFMGSEFAQWVEWDEGQALDWALLDHEMHRGVQRMVSDLNRIYVSQPALHANDFQVEGFEWLNCDDHLHSVLMFMRHGAGQSVICLLNMTPVPRTGYRIGLPAKGFYREIFNSDAAAYGGSDCGNTLVEAEAVPWMGRPFSAEFTLPPLGAVILERQP